MATDTFPRLQELCLLSLINYTNHYTPEYIALLPTTLRRRFLPLLPAVYLHKFHNTPALSDVQARLQEDELWLNIYTSYFWTYNKDDRNQPGYVKENFLNRVIEETLNFPSNTTNTSKCTNTKHIGGAVIDSLLCIPKSNEWIFSKPYDERFLSTYNLRVICKECKRICPSQLVSSFPNSFINQDDQLAGVCNILTNVFDRYPTTVISTYYEPSTIFNIASSNASVARFLSKVEELTLHGFSGPKSSRVSAGLQQIAPLFCPVLPKEVQGRPSKGFTPNSKLQSLTIIPHVDIDDEVVSILMSIIKHQESLRVFDMMFSSEFKANLSPLFYSLIHSMKRSGTEFKKLALKGTGTSYRLENFTSVLIDFLTTIPPPLSKEKQILELRFATIVSDLVSSSSVKKSSHHEKEEQKESRHQLCPQQVIDCPGKGLCFEKIHFNGNDLLSSNNLVSYHLDEITICTTRRDYCDLCDWQEVKNLTTKKISLEFSGRFTLGLETVPCYPLIGNVLKKWISCERIQALELVKVSILLNPSHLLSLTDALSKSSLTQLVLSECLLGWVSSTANTVGKPVSVLSVIKKEYAQKRIGTEFCGELVLLLTSIVSFLLKTDEFELTLQDNSLDYRHLLLIHYIWSSVCKETRTPFKLLYLKMWLGIPESLKEQFMSKMNEMALEFRIEFLKLL